MRRILEIIFPKLPLLILIVTLPLMISLAISYNQPRSYQASADLWALRQYSYITVAGLDVESGTPADTQVASLYELLQARAFALDVAKATELPATYSNMQSDPQSLEDALVSDIQRVKVGLPQGANLYTITYVNTNPKLAQEVVAAVIQTYGLQSQGINTSGGGRFLEEYKAQLEKAKQNVDAAAAAEARYLATHPALGTDPARGAEIDPHFFQLYAELQRAQAAVQSIQTNIDNLNQLISMGVSSNDLFRVVDPPIVQRVSRTKDLLKGGGIGAGIGISACALYLAFLIRRGRGVRGVYTPLDLQNVTTYPVVMELPHLTPATVALLMRSAQ
jgi:uncharacterized protein involved in exopolysaccharide biosynthesis